MKLCVTVLASPVKSSKCVPPFEQIAFHGISWDNVGMKMTRNTSRAVIKILPIVTTAILAVIWWVNGMEDTWLYLSNVLVVLTVSWAAYPKKLTDED